MPHYDFDDEDGKPVTLFLEMGEAPDYGQWRTYAGRRLKRVFERAHSVASPFIPDYAYVARSQPRWDPAAPRYDAQGHPIIANKREHQNYAAQKVNQCWE
jgi:hypothetical protein